MAWTAFLAEPIPVVEYGATPMRVALCPPVGWVSTDPDSLRRMGEGDDSNIQGAPTLVCGQREKLRSDGPFFN